nr:ABC transporter ATP-binding protein [uncultured Blautia sp.]
MANDFILEIKDLTTCFYTENGLLPAVNGVNLKLRKKETLCIVGESGCGKSVTSLSVMQLHDKKTVRYTGGEILFHGEDLLKKTEKEMQKIRGDRIAMIFQEPMTALNPVYTIGKQITEAIHMHRQVSKKEAMAQALELLNQVGIPDAPKRLKQYPHQLSGGLRQRIAIAMALACQPEILIADEPTTALDVTTQAQILRLLNELKESREMSLILVTHDLGVVAQMADYVAVMYGGRVVELAPVKELYSNPIHPYTKGLIDCVVKMDSEKGSLKTIEGMVPGLAERHKGCVFANRCPLATEKCREKEPVWTENGSHGAACWERR